MRVFTEASITLKGDEAAARRNIPLARTLLGIMKSVNRETNQVQRWRRTLPDGTRVDLASFHGRDYITIEVPASGGERFYGGILYNFPAEESYIWAAPDFETPTFFVQEKRSYYVRDTPYSWEPGGNSFLDGTLETTIPSGRSLSGVWDHSQLGQLILTYTSSNNNPTFEIFQRVDNSWTLLHSYQIALDTGMTLSGVELDYLNPFPIGSYRAIEPFTYAPGGGQIWFMIRGAGTRSTGFRILLTATNLTAPGAANFQVVEATGMICAFSLRDRIATTPGAMEFPIQSPVIESERVYSGPFSYNLSHHVSGKYLIDIGYSDGRLKKIYLDVQGRFLIRTEGEFNFTPPGFEEVVDVDPLVRAADAGEDTGYTHPSADAAGGALAGLLNTNQSSGGRYSYTFISSTDNGLLDETIATGIGNAEVGGNIRIDRFDSLNGTTTQLNSNWSFQKIHTSRSGAFLNIAGTITSDSGGPLRVQRRVDLDVPVGYVRVSKYYDDSIIYDVHSPYCYLDFLSPEIRATSIQRLFINECTARFITDEGSTLLEVPSETFFPGIHPAPGLETFYSGVYIDRQVPIDKFYYDAYYLYAPFTSENEVRRYHGPLTTSTNPPFFYAVHSETITSWEVEMTIPSWAIYDFIVDLVDAENYALVVTMVPRVEVSEERVLLSSGSQEGDFTPEDPVDAYTGLWGSKVYSVFEDIQNSVDVQFDKEWESDQFIVQRALRPNHATLSTQTPPRLTETRLDLPYTAIQDLIKDSITYKSGYGAVYNDGENYAALFVKNIDDTEEYSTTPLAFSYLNGTRTTDPFGITGEANPIYALYNISREST